LKLLDDKNIGIQPDERRMKLLTEYIERAANLERLAADEQDSEFKTQLLKQAAAYRKLAAKRAKETGCRLRALPRFQTDTPDVPQAGGDAEPCGGGDRPAP
jgi:hypothetical protein